MTLIVTSTSLRHQLSADTAIEFLISKTCACLIVLEYFIIHTRHLHSLLKRNLGEIIDFDIWS